MMIVRLRGGLGNQLFQYAFARSLQSRKSVDVRLDAVSGFESDFYERTYALEPFDIALPLASENDRRRFAPSGLSGRVRLKMGTWASLFRRPVIEVERELFSYDEPLLTQLDARTDYYFIGYWQAEQYPRAVERDLRRELTIMRPMNEQNAACAQEIRSTQSVSLHVRRHHGRSASGVVDDRATQIHGESSIEYYRKAIARVLASVSPDVVFFVFGDDPHWAEQHVLDSDLNYTIVAHNGQEVDYEDVRLMSLCRHHIIANSTFSWWGAWLNPNPNKIVIAPQRWMAEQPGSTHDLMPDTWQRL